jgi:hypothetical protein
MSAGVAAISGGRHVLRVRADYLFVYPVMSPGQPGTLLRIVRRLAVDVDFKPTGAPVDPYDQSIPPSGPGCHSVTGT